MEPGQDYVLRVGGWSSTIHTISFTMPENATGIGDIQEEKVLPHTAKDILYDLKGRVVLCPENGVYIRNGKKVYYER